MTKKKGYLIPDVIETEGRVCVSFTLPDLPEYRQAALYQIMSLGKWWAWEHDIPSQGDTAAVEVGRYLLPFLNNIQITPGECPSMGDNYVMNVEETAPMEVTVTFRDDSTSVLDLTDCCEQIPPYFRRDVINGGLEFSFDGVNWEPITIPDGEPPDWPIFDGPPPGEVWVTPPDGTDKACRVANSIIDEFKEQAEALKSRIDFNAGIILSLAQFTTSIITAGVGFYFAGPAGAAAGAAGSQAFWEVIMSATDTILEMFQGYTALSYDNLFSDPVKWREVKCWYYCNLSSDGLLDYAGYQMVLLSAEAALADNPTDDFYKFMVEQIKLFGTDGPNQSYEKWMNTEDDCTACACLTWTTWVFGDVGDDPAYTIALGTKEDGYVSGGVVDNVYGVAVDTTFGASEYINDVYVSCTVPADVSNPTVIVRGKDGPNWTGNLTFTETLTPTADGTEHTYFLAPSASARSVRWQVSSFDSDGADIELSEIAYR